jgi:methionyl-tRNA formyltransferase
MDQSSSDKPRLVFFGSGPVAAKSLELLAHHCDIEAVITKPQPPHHKEPFPVLEVAEAHGFKTFTPVGKQELSELFATRPVTSQLGVVIDYGFIINQDVIDYFPLGIINSHFSLLPEWRGADPITFAILSGQRETGVSLMLITAGMDEGPLLSQTPFEIPKSITTPELTDELIKISDWSLQKILPLYASGETTSRPQLEVAMRGHEQITYSRKLTKDDGILDFTKPAEQLEREIRAYIEWPKSRATIGGVDVIITKATVEPSDFGKPGDIDVIGTTGLRIQCGNGHLSIDHLKPAGKKEMSVHDFLLGYGRTIQAHN